MAENIHQATDHSRRVYPLDAHDLTEEQIAVAFAMTSRRPEPFDEIARQVSQEKPADFHERWVLGYGHASVAEHAVIHLAVENISRLACDSLEDNRLGSYTEKSSRYQVMGPDSFHFPQEFQVGDSQEYSEIGKLYNTACQRLFRDYQRFIDVCMDHLRQINPKRDQERESAYNLRLSRIATDSCRAVLPSATLTNVGLTANARVLEHAISKLMSSGLAEEQALGDELRTEGKKIAPTLIKYAGRNTYLVESAQALNSLFQDPSVRTELLEDTYSTDLEPQVKLVHWDPQAEEKVVAALLFRESGLGYEEISRRTNEMAQEERDDIIARSLTGLGPHDTPVRELEMVDYTFEFVLDYGAYREFKRHRMMTYIPQPLTMEIGYSVPKLLAEAGLSEQFHELMGEVHSVFRKIREQCPLAAQYLVTHSHYRRVLAKMNLRQCFHLFKLRTSEEAHFAIREPIKKALRLAADTHPGLFRHLKLRS